MRRYTHCLHRDHGLRAMCATRNNHLLSAHLCLLVRWSGLATGREGWQTSEGWQQEREREREREEGGREGGREGGNVYSVYREGYTKRCWSVQTYRLLMRSYTHCLHRDHGLRATCATINNHLLSAHLCLLVRWSGLATVREGWQTSEGWQQERERERGGRERKSTVCIERATQSVVGVCKHIGSSCGELHTLPTQGPWAESNVCHNKQSPSLCSPLPSCPLERAGNSQRGLANVRGLATGEREREEGGREGGR